MLRGLVLVGLLGLCVALPHEKVPNRNHIELFEQFKLTHNKNYADEAENRYRLAVFVDNLQKAELLDAQDEEATFGITKFMDLTALEFSTRFLTYQKKQATKAVRSLDLPIANVSAVDWVKKGAVTPVKDQGQCGSCWAFSCTEQLESDLFLKTGSLMTLSPQQVVSCDKGGFDLGCDGGDTPTCYEYIMKAGGLATEASYPYTSGARGQDGHCFNKTKVATLTDYDYVSDDSDRDEAGMENYLASRGPLSICVDAESWQFYNSGVMTRNCGTDLDHCVQLTGFNEKRGVPYWVVRNSWNTNWGEEGFIFIKRGKNLCGVADEATFTKGAKKV